MRDMVVMRDAVAKLLLNLARRIGDRSLKLGDRAGAEIGRLKMEDGMQSSFREKTVEAMLTASPVWGADEARAVAAFLNTPAGQLFSKRIRSVAAHVAIEGANTGGTRCATTANTIHSAGVSAGWNECVRYIHSLSRVSGERDTNRAPNVFGVHTDRHQPKDEAELLERLSP